MEAIDKIADSVNEIFRTNGEGCKNRLSFHLSATMPGLPTVPMWFGVGQKFKVKSSIMNYELLTDI